VCPALGCLLVVASLCLAMGADGQTDFPDVCQERADNLVRNCRFDDQLGETNRTYLPAITRQF
jgi:hypothetical protein